MSKEEIVLSEGVKYYVTGKIFDKKVTDIDITPGVKKFLLKNTNGVGAFYLKSLNKQFPDVEEIEIQDKNVYNVSLKNEMFPNLKILKCGSGFMQSEGLVLYSNRVYSGNSRALINVFGKTPVDVNLSNVTDIEYGALDGARIKSFSHVPNDISIKQGMFKGMQNLSDPRENGVLCISGILIDVNPEEDVIIPKGVKISCSDIKWENVKSATFNSIDDLEKISCLPQKVIVNDDRNVMMTDIINAFSESKERSGRCKSIEWNNKFYKSENGVLYSADGKVLIKYPEGRCEPVRIPYGVEVIEKHAFANSNAAEIYIPDTVMEIKEEAFLNAQNLRNVSLGNGVEVIRDGAFAYCYNLECLEIPSNVRFIGTEAFYNANIQKLIINEGVMTIMNSAFNAVTCSVKIPESLYFIGKGNFTSAEKLTFTKNLTNGIINAVTTRTYMADEIPRFLRMSAAGRDFIIPMHMSERNVSEIQTNLGYGNINNISDDYLESVCSKALFPEESQESALELYKMKGGDKVKIYLRRAGKSIAKRYFLNNQYDKLIELIELGILTKNTLQFIKETAERLNIVTVSAYAIDEINKSNCGNKSFNL